MGLADVAYVPRLEFYARRAFAVGRIADYKSVFPRLGVDELPGLAFDKAFAREVFDIKVIILMLKMTKFLHTKIFLKIMTRR